MVVGNKFRASTMHATEFARALITAPDGGARIISRGLRGFGSKKSYEGSESSVPRAFLGDTKLPNSSRSKAAQKSHELAAKLIQQKEENDLAEANALSNR